MRASQVLSGSCCLMHVPMVSNLYRNAVHPYVRCVISTGGGIVCRNENWSKLQTGVVVWLDVEPEVILKRIQGTDRPLLQTEDPLQTLKDLLKERKEKYA